jgi:transposase-like protein
MTKKFTQAFKIQAVQKALNQAETVKLKDIALGLGVGYSTLQKWIADAKKHKLDLPINWNDMSTEKRPQDWTLEQRLDAIIVCGSLEEEKVSEYCRANGIYPHHIKQWKLDFAQGSTPKSKAAPAETKQLKTEIKQLKKELNRKDKALAETAALLVLKKKVDAIWGTAEDD